MNMQAPVQSERRIAILIGASDFPRDPENLHQLSAPKFDLEQMKKVLESEDRGDFDRIDIHHNKTSGEVYEAIENTIYDCGENDLLLIYYSGHGWTDIDGKLYLAFKNTVIRSVRANSIAFESLKHTISDPLKRVRKIIVVLDCCFAGAVQRSLTKGAAQSELRQMAQDAEGTVILTAADSNQTAKQSDDGSLSVFTKHLVEGIKTGVPDTMSTGRITINDLSKYIRKNVHAENRQRPKVFGLGVNGDIVISYSGKEKSPTTSVVPVDRIQRLMNELEVPDNIDVLSALNRLGAAGTAARSSLGRILDFLESDKPELVQAAAFSAVQIDPQSIKLILNATKENPDLVRELIEVVCSLDPTVLASQPIFMDWLDYNDPKIANAVETTIRSAPGPFYLSLIEGIDRNKNELIRSKFSALAVECSTGSGIDANKLHKLIKSGSDKAVDELCRGLVRGIEGSEDAVPHLIMSYSGKTDMTKRAIFLALRALSPLKEKYRLSVQKEIDLNEEAAVLVSNLILDKDLNVTELFRCYLKNNYHNLLMPILQNNQKIYDDSAAMNLVFDCPEPELPCHLRALISKNKIHNELLGKVEKLIASTTPLVQALASKYLRDCYKKDDIIAYDSSQATVPILTELHLKLDTAGCEN